MERKTYTTTPENLLSSYGAPLLEEFEKQITAPPGGDQRIALFFQAYVDLIHGDGVPDEKRVRVADQLSTIATIMHDREVVPSYAANKLLRCFQKQFMYRKHSHDYPYTDQSVDPWQSAIVSVLTGNGVGEVLQDYYTRPTQSNIVQRYNTLKFILAATLDSEDHAPQVLDIGCSQNLGLKKIALGRKFDPVTIVGFGDLSIPAQSQTATQRYNDVLAKPVKLGKSLGVDLLDMRDASNAEWEHACSSYPSELLDVHRQEESRKLHSAYLAHVGFTQADISMPLVVNTDTHGPIDERRTYDVAFASTSMYQMTNEERDRTYEMMYDRLNANGVMIIQDFVELQGKRLRFSGPGSDTFAYRTIIKNKQTDFEQPEELLIWETARCSKVRLGLGRLVVEGKARPISAYLAEA